jgi:hypothetical protein
MALPMDVFFWPNMWDGAPVLAIAFSCLRKVAKKKWFMVDITILVGGIPTPLKNMSSSVGMMNVPIYGKIKHVPNHHQ